MSAKQLQDAAQYLGADDTTPELYADSGIENVNGDVNALVDENLIHRVLAQIEVAFSNSLIEAWWRSLRNNWLHLNTLDTVAAVRRLTSFYVAEHDTAIPHNAFHGETPDEMYFGTGTAVAARLQRRNTRGLRDGLLKGDPNSSRNTHFRTLLGFEGATLSTCVPRPHTKAFSSYGYGGNAHRYA